MTVLERRLPGRLPRLPAEWWIGAGAIGAAGFATASLFGETAFLLCAAIACLAAGAAFYEQRLIGPLLALALPLEITKLAFPFLETRAELGGGLGATSIVDAGRLVVALAFAVWLVRPGRPRSDVLPVSPLTLPLALLFTVYACSTLWAFDPGAARTETLRLLFSLGSFALVPFFVRDRASLRWTLLALVASAAVLSVIGVYQQATGEFLWNEGLGEFGERRINTTFADPNHFARFLVEAIVVALALWCFVSGRMRWRLLAPAIALALVTLVFTGSRGAWIVAAVALPCALLIVPVDRGTRMRVAGAGLAIVTVVVASAAAVSPFFTKRVETFAFGVEAFGARPYLVEAGLAMFGDHPLTGVGAGGYQSSFEADYYEYKDPKIKANVTASHTSGVTVLSELGVLGVIALLFVAARWVLYVRDTARTRDAELRTYVLAVGIVSGVILLGSQTEGRFLEDPYLWLVGGLVVAIDGLRRKAAPDAAPLPNEAGRR